MKEDHCDTAALSMNRTKWVFLHGIDCIDPLVLSHSILVGETNKSAQLKSVPRANDAMGKRVSIECCMALS